MAEAEEKDDRELVGGNIYRKPLLIGAQTHGIPWLSYRFSHPLMVSSCAPSPLSSDPAMRGIQRFWLSRGHLVGGRSGEEQGHGSMGIMIIIPWNLGLPYFQTNQHFIVSIYIETYIYIELRICMHTFLLNCLSIYPAS